MQNDKLKIVVYFLLVFIFIISSYFGFQYLLNPQNINKRAKINTAEEINKTPEKTGLYWQEQADEIIKTNDFNKCDEIEDELYRKVCVNNIALNLANEKQDISYCEKLDNELVPIADCESRVIYAKAMDKEDISVCEETENQELRKSCENSFWLSYAIKKEDISICGNKTGEAEKNACHNSYLLQKEFIADMADFDCGKFKGSSEKSDCAVFKENLSANRASSCADLNSELFKNFCRLYF